MGDWMYTSTRSEVRHWSVSSLLTGRRYAICGLDTPYGTGSQTEYERAKTLRACANCVRLGALGSDR